MSILSDWINPYYLRETAIFDIQETLKAKPSAKYVVLDNFFIESKIDELINYHKTLQFTTFCDKIHPDGSTLPYDSEVNFATPNQGLGSQLYFCTDWLSYLANLCQLPYSPRTEIKQRYHSAEAGGFWIHTDSIIRNIAAICYFNKNWRASDGGLLQIWEVDDVHLEGTPIIDHPSGVMDMLDLYNRIATSSPGGGFADNKQHDLILVDQIVPTYNRLFLCNMKASPCYHSVSPSHGRVRLGFVQWILDP